MCTDAFGALRHPCKCVLVSLAFRAAVFASQPPLVSLQAVLQAIGRLMEPYLLQVDELLPAGGGAEDAVAAWRSVMGADSVNDTALGRVEAGKVAGTATVRSTATTCIALTLGPADAAAASPADVTATQQVVLPLQVVLRLDSGSGSVKRPRTEALSVQGAPKAARTEP